jgi:hypothetical protein
MKSSFLIMVFLALSFSFCFGSNQDSLEIKKAHIVFGTEFSLFYQNVKDQNTNDLYLDFQYRFEPELVYLTKSGIGFGVQGIYEHLKSNYHQTPKLYGLGALIRYYQPMRYKDKFESSFFRYINLHLFAEVGYLITNYHVESLKSTPVVIDKMNVSVLSFPIGISLRLWKGLHHEIAIRPELYYPSSWVVVYQLGFKYKFKLQ